MTKAELINTVATEWSVTKAQAEGYVNSVIIAITGALKKGDRVQLAGLGVFNVAKRKAKTARNPRTGEEIKVPARKVVTFKPSADLKEAVK